MTRSEANTTLIALGKRLASTPLEAWLAFDIISDMADSIVPIPEGSLRLQNDRALARLVACNYGREAFGNRRQLLGLQLAQAAQA